MAEPKGMNFDEILLSFGIGRRSADDPFFTEGDIACQALRRLGVFDIDDEKLCHEILPSFPCNIPGCILIFDSVFEFDLHYNSVHRYKCSECKKQLPSPHLLDLHLSETHDSFFLAQAERKPMYCCYVEVCDIKFANPQERRDHCISSHKFPHDFRFDDARKQKSHPAKKNVFVKENAMDTASSDQPLPTKIKKSKKKSSEQKPGNESDMVIDNELGTGRGNVTFPSKSFKPFSFGRGGRGGGRGRRGGNWHQSSTSTAPRASTLETSMVDDLLSSLPQDVEPMT